jgi:hypothetical protein
MRENGAHLVSTSAKPAGAKADVNVDAMPDTIAVCCDGKRVSTRPVWHTELDNVFDRHPPLEILFEEVADQPLRAVSALPPDDIETKQSRHDNRRDEDDPGAAHYWPPPAFVSLYRRSPREDL